MAKSSMQQLVLLDVCRKPGTLQSDAMKEVHLAGNDTFQSVFIDAAGSVTPLLVPLSHHPLI